MPDFAEEKKTVMQDCANRIREIWRERESRSKTTQKVKILATVEVSSDSFCGHFTKDGSLVPHCFYFEFDINYCQLFRDHFKSPSLEKLNKCKSSMVVVNDYDRGFSDG